VALHVYANYEMIDDITNGALYYHADYVNPGWKLKKTKVIGRHIFYKEGSKI
jgi:spore germination cell wall hydrolase CwlJ-like protein